MTWENLADFATSLFALTKWEFSSVGPLYYVAELDPMQAFLSLNIVMKGSRPYQSHKVAVTLVFISKNVGWNLGDLIEYEAVGIALVMSTARATSPCLPSNFATVGISGEFSKRDQDN